MEYYFYATNAWCDFERTAPYIVKFYNKGAVAKIVFDDASYSDFIKELNLSDCIEKFGGVKAFGVDGFLYNITAKGSIKCEKYPSNYPKLHFKSQNQSVNGYNSDLAYKERILNDIKHGKVKKSSKGILGFNKYLYVNEDINFVMPYRFKKAKKTGQPLVVYFAGGGTLGHDNWNPLREFLGFSGGNKIIKSGCNILIPQMMRVFDKEDTDNTINDRLTVNCALLIKQLLKENDIDNNRIYVYGTSLGGKCVWSALLNSPNLYAVAVEAMGEYLHYETLKKADFETISHVPIWMAHSSDDKVVNIASDDYFYDNLKSLGANVKYTRWDKYGHAMASKFYKKEPWVEWMFSQSK